MSRKYLAVIAPWLAGLALIGALAFIPEHAVFAQEVTESLEAVGEQTGLGSEDPKIIVAKIIRAGLGILGVVVVLLVLYGGWVWMTAGGNPERVDTAKKILIRAFIGLTIILLSFAITSFVLSSLLDATQNNNGGSGSGSGGGGGLGGGSSSSFTVTDYSPEAEVPIRNVQLVVTFSKLLDADTVDGNIVVTNAGSGEEVDGTITVSGNRATFVPTAACPSPNEDRFCFDAFTQFLVEVSSDIDSSTGVGLACGSDRCTSSFTTGDLVDTEDPTATVTDPEDGDGVSSMSYESIQVHATDDSQIANAAFTADGREFDSIGAEGDVLTDVTIETLWDTSGLENGTRYKIGVTVTDIAGNTDEDSVTVVARPAWCFNGELDADLGETNIDCGGDSSSADYCGACDGSACTENSQCSSGSCVNGTCVSSPEIESISPDNGAVGTYVTISGSGFGREGKVRFTAEDGSLVEASIPSCGDWSPTEIVVEVPAGAGDGPITVTNDSGYSDASDDDNGPLVDDFDVNDVVRPKLCSIQPDSAEATEAVILTGLDFGDVQATSTVSFGATNAGSYTNWEDTSVAVTVPSSEAGSYEVLLTVNGVDSNAVEFEIEKTDAGSLPVITGLDPASGAVGDYVSISGSNFGALTGSVFFVNEESGEETLAENAFPAACAADWWSHEEIIVIVPDVDPGSYGIYVTTQGGVDSEEIDFTVEDGAPSPGICAIEPDSGDVGDIVTIYGDRLGTSTGSVKFYSDVSATATVWSDDEVRVTVPSGAVTGPLSLASPDGEESNSMDFAVGTTEEDVTASAAPASYGWYFSTGEIPLTPEVTVACTDTVVSGVPNARFTEEVCTNAVVTAQFTTLMNEGSISDALTVEQCTSSGDDPCDTSNDVTADGYLEVTSTTAFTYFAWTPASLKTSTTYRVSISTEAMSDNGTELAEDVSWSFVTKESDEACEVEEVNIIPNASTLVAEGETERFRAQPVSGCVVPDADDYTWKWNVNASYASFTSSTDENVSCDGAPDDCATVMALAEGITDVTAMETASIVEGSGELTINFTDPYVASAWPNCGEACLNAEIGARFNTPMSQTTLENGGVALYACANELCSNLTEVGSYSVECAEDTSGTETCREVSITTSSLEEGTYYRVVISGDVTSASGVALTRTNYSGDYSWTFRVKDGDAVCAIERISMTPDAVRADVVGERVIFTVDAYGSPDSCSDAGQLLTAGDYRWSWTDPIADDGDDDAISVAEWVPSGDIDVNLSSIAAGCTASCTAAGSDSYAAMCGDGTIGTGEECEDGNTSDGDGCSSSCLREGGDYIGICGNGIREWNDTSVLLPPGDGAGEECDDGNLNNGDGCSALCLNEGSNVIGSTCGNEGDVAHDDALGGEDCDDGNSQSGDGCSSQCLYEGTPTVEEVGGAVCGDGKVTEPYENCDTALTAEGCSDRCLLMGSSAYYSTPSYCGRDGIGIGEECDEGDAVDGDGCSSKCLLEGSSVSFDVPSFCGDGKDGTGELRMCELHASGDGYVEHLQIAEITEDAPQEVNQDTNEAIATISVEEPESGFVTTATYTLSCAATSDEQCEDSALYGVGLGNCCIERPTVALYPPQDMENVCRNSAIYGEFTKEMDLDSFFTTLSDESEEPNMYLVLDLASVGATSCSDVDGHTQLARAPRHWASRLWYGVRRFVVGASAEAASGDCVVPVVGFTQEYDSSSQTYTVRLRYDTLLVANAKYTLMIEGDADYTDADAEGVRSANQVALADEFVIPTTFTTGNEVCTLDKVTIEDSNEESTFYFSQTNETHTFTATAISYESGMPQEIEPIDGVYDWEWTNWSDDMDGAIVDVTASSTAGEENIATVSAEGENGETNVTVTAIITSESDIDAGSSVAGSETVTAYLCENPWPAIENFPFTDDADGADAGAQEDSGWMHFSTYYCRDGQDSDEDGDGADEDEHEYADVTVVLPENRQITSDVVLKEYLFKVADGSGDAIGLRVVANAQYLSPSDWFAAQGFSGTPEDTTVDGFAAVTDGRTTYVAAPNVDNADLYSNIYVISYNEGASDDTIAIYDQMLENLSFAINVDDTALCLDSSGTSYATDTDGEVVACTSDADCSEVSGTCANAKAKLTRDTRRLADMMTIADLVEDFGAANGTCSETTSQSCDEDADCPTDESCESIVPTLASGTYIRALGASPWASWTDLLGAALEDSELVTDPLNAYEGCGVGDYTAYDSATCVNQTRGEYVCPEGSYAYHYRAVGERDFELYTDLEYSEAAWFNSIDADTDDEVTITVGNSSSTADGFSTAAFCNGVTVYGSSGTCGDGVVQGSEECEVGDIGGDTVACSVSDEDVPDASCSGESDTTTCGSGGSCEATGGVTAGDYVCSLVSASTCSVDADCNTSEQCVVQESGVSYCALVVRAATCGSYSDDASCSAVSPSAECTRELTEAYACTPITNGVQSQVCGSSCTWETDADAACVATECGDGIVDPGEDCDDGAYNGRYGYCGSMCNYTTAAYCGDGKLAGSEVCDCGVTSDVAEGARPYGGTPDTCIGPNGTYAANGAITCAWDCLGPANYCGDGTVDAGEECDGDTDTWAGALCFVPYNSNGMNQQPCVTDDDCTEGATNTLDIEIGYCTTRTCESQTHICVAGDPSTIGTVCTTDEQCDSSTAGDGVCSAEEYSTTRVRTCADDVSAGETCQWAQSWSALACTSDASCGNGVIDDNEECDDGNDVGSDACTTECTVNVCGDGYLYEGEEDCDEGALNGAGCDASYGSSCAACSITCHYEVSSGEFCGDGEINGNEFCDASAMTYTYYDSDTGDTYGNCSTLGDEIIDSSGNEYTCRNLGICNGGDNNGGYCTTDSGIALVADTATCGTFGGDCVFPTCADNCTSSCPDTFASTSLLVTTNAAGARSTSSVALYSYSAESTSDLPNAATITVPACNVISGLTADIDTGDITPPDTYIIFVTDLSPSMDYEVANNSAPESGESSRYQVATASLEAAFSTLYEELGEYAHIGLVAYKREPSGECRMSNNSCATDLECAMWYVGDTCNLDPDRDYRSLGFTDAADEADLVTEVQSYYADLGGNGTPMTEGLTAAKDMMDAVYAGATSNARYIIVLLSDGQVPSTETAPDSVIASITDRYELFTAAISTGSYLETMSEWSSGDPDTETGIDYAYDAQTEAELADMYDEIVNSIVDVGITLISDDNDRDGDAEVTTGTIADGLSISLPWPEGFVCDPYGEQEIPIRLQFQGEGQIEISNVQIEYCAP